MKCVSFASMLSKQAIAIRISGNEKLAEELDGLATAFSSRSGDVTKAVADLAKVTPTDDARPLARLLAATAEVHFAASASSAMGKDAALVAEVVAAAHDTASDRVLPALKKRKTTTRVKIERAVDGTMVADYVDRLRASSGAEALELIAAMKADRSVRHAEVQQILLAIHPKAKLAKGKATDLKALERYYKGERSRDAKDAALRP